MCSRPSGYRHVANRCPNGARPRMHERNHCRSTPSIPKLISAPSAAAECHAWSTVSIKAVDRSSNRTRTAMSPRSRFQYVGQRSRLSDRVETRTAKRQQIDWRKIIKRLAGNEAFDIFSIFFIDKLRAPSRSCKACVSSQRLRKPYNQQ